MCYGPIQGMIHLFTNTFTSLFTRFLTVCRRAQACSRASDRGAQGPVPAAERARAGGTEGGGGEGGGAQGHHRAGETALAQGTRLQVAGIPAQGVPQWVLVSTHTNTRISDLKLPYTNDSMGPAFLATINRWLL